ncbi:invasion associated locus B family protein [Alphaproteobacteria bacterium]|nr:invasion associated locus B family protein [Alphaproteobacteria bacterium]
MFYKNFLILILVFFVKSSLFAHDLSFKHDHGKWTLKKASNKTCSILQIPLKEEGDYKLRGAVLFYVFKDGDAEYVRIDAGYPYSADEYVKVTIDNNSYQFFGEDDSAWSMKDDKVIIDAMKAGKIMSVVGYSKKGTKTLDTYTLIGFTSAYKSLQQDC